MPDLLILAALLVLAHGVGRRLLRAVPFRWPLEEALFALAMSLGLCAYLTLALALLGVLRREVLLAVLVVAGWWARREIAAGLAIAARGARRWWASRPAPSERGAVVLGAALVVAAIVPDLAPAVGGDQTKYQLVYPRLYAEAHGLVPTPWSFWGYMQYLMNMLFTAGFVLRGDVLARLLHATYGVLTTLGIFALGRRLFSRRVGVWAAILFLSMPLTATLMSRAWVELTLTLYVLLGVLAVLAWRDEGAGGWLVLGGWMAGFAAGTKLMGLLAPALLGVLVFTARARAGVGRAVVTTIAFGALAAAVAAPCYLRNAVETGNPIYPFGYGVFGGRAWSAEAAAGLDDYYAHYRERQAERRGGHAYASWLETLHFPWDATMAPHSFEESGRMAYDPGPFLLAFAPAVLWLRRAPRAWLLAGLAVAYGAIVVLGMWAHPRYVHPALPLLAVVAVCALDALRAWGPAASRLVTAVLALTVLAQSALSARLLAPTWPDSARVALGILAPDEFLRRHERRWPLWSLVNAVVPADGNVLVLGTIPHPYHLERRFTLASPLEQGAIDYRRLASVDELDAALDRFGVTHVVRAREREKPGANPVGPRVTRLWEDLLARCEKIAEVEGGALYRRRAALAGGAGGGAA